MIVALIPIVGLEALVIAKKLKLRYWPTVGWACLSNILPTVVGIPLTWGVLVVMQLVTGGGRGASARGAGAGPVASWSSAVRWRF
jgi:hypothetical protein